MDYKNIFDLLNKLFAFLNTIYDELKQFINTFNIQYAKLKQLNEMKKFNELKQINEKQFNELKQINEEQFNELSIKIKEEFELVKIVFLIKEECFCLPDFNKNVKDTFDLLSQ